MGQIRSRTISRNAGIYLTLLLALSISGAVQAAPLGQEDDPAELCAAGAELFGEGQYAEALP